MYIVRLFFVISYKSARIRYFRRRQMCGTNACIYTRDNDNNDDDDDNDEDDNDDVRL